MRQALRFLGWAGLVLFLFGLVSYALTSRFDLWTALHVAGGGILLAAGIAANFAGFRRSVTARGTRERTQAALGAALFAGLVVVANVAAARKLAVLYYNTLRYGVAFVEKGLAAYEQHHRDQSLRRLQAAARRFGMTLVPTPNPA